MKEIAGWILRCPNPECRMEVEEDVVYCPFCGTRIKIIEQPTVPQTSFKQPIRNLAILYVFTFGLYCIYWFYRNWKHLKIHKNLDISPGWRTVAFFIPIFNIVIIYEQFKKIRDFAEERGCEGYSAGLLTAGFIFLYILEFLFTWNMHRLYYLVVWIPFLLRLWILIIIQNTLNNYWEKEQIGLPERTEFSDIEIVVLIIGGIFLILYILYIFLIILHYYIF